VSTSENQPAKKPIETWKIVALVMVAGLVLYTAINPNLFKSSPKNTMTIEEQRQKASDELTSKYTVTPAWFPSDFNEFAEDPNVAWRWLENKEFTCSLGDACWGMLVVSKNGCPNSLYVEVSILDSSGTQVSYSHDSLSVAAPMQKNKLTFESFDSSANTARLAKISCR
jgi:hypothetical protein